MVASLPQPPCARAPACQSTAAPELIVVSASSQRQTESPAQRSRETKALVISEVSPAVARHDYTAGLQREHLQ